MKYMPFILTYSREHNPLQSEDQTNILLIDNYDWTDQMEEKLHEQINDQIWTLLETCEQARRLIKIAQSKQQLYLDQKLNKPSKEYFQIGDVILLHHTYIENQLSGKLEDKWQRPYYIYDSLNNGSYK